MTALPLSVRGELISDPAELIPAPAAPFRGVKRSGLGREGDGTLGLSGGHGPHKAGQGCEDSETHADSPRIYCNSEPL